MMRLFSPNIRDTNYRNIQYTHNEALRIATGCHKMSSIDHLHLEAKILKVREHSELLSGYWKLLGSYKSRIKKDTSLNVCADCGKTPHEEEEMNFLETHDSFKKRENLTAHQRIF